MIVKIWHFSHPATAGGSPLNPRKPSTNEIARQIQEFLDIGMKPVLMNQSAWGYQNQDMCLTVIFDDSGVGEHVAHLSHQDGVEKIRIISSVSTPVEQVFAGKEILKWLLENGFTHMGDLTRSTSADLWRMRGFRSKWLGVIKAKLATLGLSFKE